MEWLPLVQAGEFFCSGVVSPAHEVYVLAAGRCHGAGDGAFSGDRLQSGGDN